MSGVKPLLFTSLELIADHRLRIIVCYPSGNPFNQLAVISTYVHDPFTATYFYFRALSIQDPFVTARGNLQSTLRRPLDAWKAAGRGVNVTVGGGVVDEARLKKEAVLLQAMFALKSG